MQHRGDGGDEERGRQGVSIEQPENPGHADAGAVFTLTELARRTLATAQRQGLVIRVEGERHRATGAVGPNRGLERAARAHLLDNWAQAVFGPGPRLFGVGIGGPGHRRILKSSIGGPQSDDSYSITGDPSEGQNLIDLNPGIAACASNWIPGAFR